MNIKISFSTCGTVSAILILALVSLQQLSAEEPNANTESNVADGEVAELIQQLNTLGEYSEKTGSILRESYTESSKEILAIKEYLKQFQSRFENVLSVLKAHTEFDEKLAITQQHLAELQAKRNTENDPDSLQFGVDGLAKILDGTQSLLDLQQSDLDTAEKSSQSVKTDLNAPDSTFAKPKPKE